MSYIPYVLISFFIVSKPLKLTLFQLRKCGIVILETTGGNNIFGPKRICIMYYFAIPSCLSSYFYQVYPISSDCSSQHSCTWTRQVGIREGIGEKQLLDQHKNPLWLLHYIHPWLIGISHTFMDINGVGRPDVPLCAGGDSRAFSLLFTRPANWDVVPHCYWQ